VDGVEERELAEVAQLSSLADETPEGRSIVVLARQYGIRVRELAEREHEFIPFSATTPMSGVELNGNRLRKGAPDAVKRFVEENGGHAPAILDQLVLRIAGEGGTPLVVARTTSAAAEAVARPIAVVGLNTCRCHRDAPRLAPQRKR
jgi:K+-transporting ATPase ATPase B chain